jgi:chemotaxis protein MotB
MSAGGGGRKGKRRGGHEAPHADERWLISYADMITLLMALFVVLWSMGVVNTSKFEALSLSLKEAFSGRILPGGEAVVLPGSSSDREKATPEPPLPAIAPTIKASEGDGRRADAAQKEAEDLERLKREIDAWTAANGLDRKVQTSVDRRGLVVRVLTDDVLFSSGSATVRPESDKLLDALSRLLKTQVRNPIQVEGNTDDVPVSGTYPTNWELSTARATAIVRDLIRRGVWPDRLSATGYADRNPIASNATEGGRQRNRRVEIVVLRMNTTGQGGR